MRIEQANSPKVRVYTVIRLIFLVNCLFGIEVLAQCKLPSLEKPVPKMNRIKIVPNGFVELPKGSKVDETGGRIDFWLRKITFENSSFKINVSAGLVESIFDDFKDDFICTENGQIGKANFRISIAKKGGKDFILAKVFWTQFIAEVTSDKEKALFNHIVQSYSTN